MGELAHEREVVMGDEFTQVAWCGVGCLASTSTMGRTREFRSDEVTQILIDHSRVIMDLRARVEDLGALVGRLQSDRYEGVDRQGILDRIVALERRADQATNGG